MLLRSSSTPILNSCLLHISRSDSSPEPEFHSLQRTNSISFRSASSIDDYSSKKVINGSNAKPPHCSSKKYHCKNLSIDEDHEEMEEANPRSTIQRLFSSSGLMDGDTDSEKERFALQTLVEGGGTDGGGRRSDGEFGSDGSEFYSSTDAYYEKMISEDPRNSLLLGNYAKFLKDVRIDCGKAEEEYYERAILANPNDGNVLSLYADLIWEKDEDSNRAEDYFDQAVKAAPDDSYVLASYARFLWDAEEEEEDNENELKSAPTFFSGHSPLATSS